MSEPILAIIYTVLGCAVISLSQMTGKLAVAHISPVKVCFLRFGLAAPLCYGVSVYSTGSFLLPFSLSLILMISFIGILAWGFGALMFYFLMNKDSMHRIVPVCNSVSIFTVTLSVIFLGETFFPILGVVVIMLIAGIFLMAPSAAATKRWAPAIPLAIFVSLVWAVNLVLTKVYITGVPLPAFVFVKMAAATLFHLFLLPFDHTPINMEGFKYSVFSAVLLVIGDILLMMGLSGLPASIFSPVFASVIPFGFLLSVFILGEQPVRRNWAGMTLIFLSAVICGYLGAK